VWTVSALVQAFSDALNARFNSLSVRGEISGLVRAASGHQYFNLKDGTAQLRCV
jgi:exodeoxyribonuclease VII large subunit